MKKYLIVIFILLHLDVFSQRSGIIPVLIPTYDNKDMKWKPPTINTCCVLDSLKVIYKVMVQFRHPFARLDKENKVDNVRLDEIRISGFKGSVKKTLSYSESKTFSPFQKYIWNICSDKLQEWYKYQPYNEYYYSRDEFKGKRIRFMGVLYITNK